MSALASTSAPQSGHTAGSGSRTSIANCVRQPRHSPATVSRRSGNTAGRCAPSSPPPRSTLLHRQAHDVRPSPDAAESSRPRMSASSIQWSAAIGAMTLHVNRWVGDRQQDLPVNLQGRAERKMEEASLLGPLAAGNVGCGQPRRRPDGGGRAWRADHSVSRPGSSLSGSVPRPQACSKSTRSPLESHEIAQSGSFRTALPGESLPIGSGSADPANARGPESARAAARPPPSSARIRATSRSDFRRGRPCHAGRRRSGAHVRAAATGRTRSRTVGQPDQVGGIS